MFRYYLTYWDDLPADSGYETFGSVHLIWLAGIVLSIVFFSRWFLKSDHRKQKRILRCLGIFILAMEGYKECVLLATGHWEVENLPLHLCGLAIFLEALYVFFPNRFLGETICTACLPGAAAALLFPDWLRYPTINYMNLHGFLVHGALVLLPVLVMISGNYRPKIRCVWMPLLFLAVLSPFLYRFNVRFGTNFMFLNRPSAGSPFTDIYEGCGYRAYLAVYIAAVIGVIVLVTGIIQFLSAAGKKRF